MTAIVVACTFDTVTRKKDRSAVLKFSTNTEISVEDFSAMDARVLSEGWLCFASNPTDMEIPDEPATSREGKSKAQRLRSVFYLLWQKQHIDEDFEAWYTRSFEKLLDAYKDKLD